MTAYITLLRPHQYVKNIFIFLPIFFGGQILDTNLLLRVLIAFIAFSLIASSVYIFNDYHDIEEDRKHPEKKYRPLAKGEISKRLAIYLMFILLFSGLGIFYFLNISAFVLALFYLFLNLAYTIILKHVPIIDVLIVSLGFIIRIYLGGIVTMIEPSMWSVIITFLLALFLVLGKRRDDMLILTSNEKCTRKVIDGYNIEFINMSMIIMASITIVSYIMYTISPEVTSRIGSNKLYLTVIFVLAGIMRFLQLSLVENKSGSPTMILLKDRFIQITILIWIITFGVMLYLPQN